MKKSSALCMNFQDIEPKACKKSTESSKSGTFFSIVSYKKSKITIRFLLGFYRQEIYFNSHNYFPIIIFNPLAITDDAYLYILHIYYI